MTACQMAPTQEEGENTVRKYYKMVQYFMRCLTCTKTTELKSSDSVKRKIISLHCLPQGKKTA